MNKKIQFYNKIKEELKQEYVFVTGAKSQVADLIVYGIAKDILVKIITHEDEINIEKHINYLTGRFSKVLTKKVYLLICVDRNYNELRREIMELN